MRSQHWLVFGGLGLIAALFLFPIWWMVAASFKPELEIMSHTDSWRTFWPTSFHLDNYRDVFRRTPFLLYLWNSVVQTGLIVGLGLVVNSLCGYALARLRFPGQPWLLAAIVALVIVPFESIVIPLFLMVTRLHWQDTYAGLVVPFIGNALSIYLFYSFFLGLPRELEEAARIDGAGYLATFTRVVAPVAKPVYAAAAILTFLQYWNDFLWPLLITTGEARRTVQVGLQTFFHQPPIQWGDVMAATVLATLPVLIFFLLFQRHFVQGIARSGIKG